MVSILPPKRNVFSGIAEAMSEFGRNAPQLLEERYQTQRGISAIDDLENALKTGVMENGKRRDLTPQELTAKYAKVATLNPQAGKALGPLLQTALTNTQGQATGNALSESEGDQPAPRLMEQNQNVPDQSLTGPISREEDQPIPGTAKGSKLPPSDINGIANQYIGVVRPDLVNPATEYGAINTFNGLNKQDLSASEEGQLRQQLTDRYKNQAVVDAVVNRVREGVKNRFNEAQTKFGFDKDRLAQIQKKWGDFAQGTPTRLEPHLSKYGEGFPKTKEGLQNKYNEYAGSLPTNMTPEQMHTNAMAMLQKDINKVDALQALPSMPPVRNEKGVADYLETNKRVYKDLADIGLIDAAKEDALLNKDMGNEEFHSMIWGDQTDKKFLNSLHGIKAPEEYFGKGRGLTKYNTKYPQEHERYISQVSDVLGKMKPEDDLILSRAMVLDSGGDIKDFNEALSKAEENGLKLSEFQQSQLQEANMPRVPPLWELFREGGPSFAGGYVQFMNWGPFINYLRGKK